MAPLTWQSSLEPADPVPTSLLPRLLYDVVPCNQVPVCFVLSCCLIGQKRVKGLHYGCHVRTRNLGRMSLPHVGVRPDDVTVLCQGKHTEIAEVRMPAFGTEQVELKVSS